MDWDAEFGKLRMRPGCVSIPQSEFDGLGRAVVAFFIWPSSQVSIPQSEFDGLGRTGASVGKGTSVGFQFPSRNSMDWDHRKRSLAASAQNVSIPQSEFDGLGHSSGRRCLPAGMVSIPQSEFDGLGRRPPASPHPRRRRFQFPSRNSMDWDDASRYKSFSCTPPVSIPQSEFDGLGP